jgi:hypothetical protein
MHTAVRHSEAPKSHRYAGDKWVAWYVPLSVAPQGQFKPCYRKRELLLCKHSGNSDPTMPAMVSVAADVSNGKNQTSCGIFCFIFRHKYHVVSTHWATIQYYGCECAYCTLSTSNVCLKIYCGSCQAPLLHWRLYEGSQAPLPHWRLYGGSQAALSHWRLYGGSRVPVDGYDVPLGGTELKKALRGARTCCSTGALLTEHIQNCTTNISDELRKTGRTAESRHPVQTTICKGKVARCYSLITNSIMKYGGMASHFHTFHTGAGQLRARTHNVWGNNPVPSEKTLGAIWSHERSGGPRRESNRSSRKVVTTPIAVLWN